MPNPYTVLPTSTALKGADMASETIEILHCDRPDHPRGKTKCKGEVQHRTWIAPAMRLPTGIEENEEGDKTETYVDVPEEEREGDFCDGAWEPMAKALELFKALGTPVKREKPEAGQTALMEAPKPANGNGGKGTKSTPIKGGASVDDVRRWAKANNMPVKEKGRLPEMLILAYNAAN